MLSTPQQTVIAITWKQNLKKRKQEFRCNESAQMTPDVMIFSLLFSFQKNV
jgi:hypothetical protein